MAWTGVDSRDIPPDIPKLKCHPGREYRHVVCLLCDSAFCRGDFIRSVEKKQGFFITKTVVVCSLHSNITCVNNDNIDKGKLSSVDLLKFIIKKKIALLNQELGNISTNPNAINEINKEVTEEDMHTNEDIDDDVEAEEIHDNKNKSRKKRKMDSSNGVEDDYDSEEECIEHEQQIAYLNTMLDEVRKNNDQLHEYNKELMNNNSFLRNLVDNTLKENCDVIKKIAEKEATPVPTFADIANRNKNTASLQQVSLVLQPQQGLQGDISSIIKAELIKQQAVKVLDFKSLRNGNVLIKCKSEIDSERIKNVIAENNLKISIKTDLKKDPLLKVIDVNNDLSESDLKNDICVRNNVQHEHLSIVHIFKSKKKNTRHLIVKVNTQVYTEIMEFKSLFVGYQRCKVYDEFNINRCWKCNGYNHSGKKCDKQTACGKCSENHFTKDCTCQEIRKCINCIKANNYLEKKRDINHSALEIDKCESYRALWEKTVAGTKYPGRPNPPFERRVSPA